MAYLSDSNISMAVKALKLLFFSAGLLSTAVMVKEAFVPFLCEIFFPNLVAFWNSFRCFLSSPLYICIIINSVVLLIAATSSSHRHDDDPPPPPEATTLCSDEQTLYHGSVIGDDCAPLATSDVNDDVVDDVVEIEAPESLSDHISDYDHERDIEKRDTVDSNSEPSLSRGDHEREAEGDDTMDSTWQTIVEGRSKKLTKSESVPPRSRVEEHQHRKELRKLETFNDGASIRRLGGLRRDPSLDVDEFNRQVEAFINKFNRDMRLQRQESDQRFLDMIKRGL
ncbi:uncharacterized protein LOC131024710 [Salvia miltiorrhiza]|uniref:uncharacterized protein LOC131024710 n=1 Tax=Salvia miltiorrhiza TaxID=226208 RepID=UPI0025ACA7AF|nr:uncharacterized protein LOC131024710 [Salvia miltiorrhiza]